MPWHEVALNLTLPPPVVPAGAGSGSTPYLTGFGHSLCLSVCKEFQMGAFTVQTVSRKNRLDSRL